VVEILNTDQFVRWFLALRPEETSAVEARVELLSERGPELKRPVVGEIRGSAFDPRMKELRCPQGIRVLFIFDPQRQAVLLIGGNKTGNWSSWYKTAIAEADELYRAYLRETGQEEDS
jgi:hypothetical protein